MTEAERREAVETALRYHFGEWVVRYYGDEAIAAICEIFEPTIREQLRMPIDDAEKIRRCPFAVDQKVHRVELFPVPYKDTKWWRLECAYCGYRSVTRKTKSETIAAHNEIRRQRDEIAAKEKVIKGHKKMLNTVLEHFENAYGTLAVTLALAEVAEKEKRSGDESSEQGT